VRGGWTFSSRSSSSTGLCFDRADLWALINNQPNVFERGFLRAVVERFSASRDYGAPLELRLPSVWVAICPGGEPRAMMSSRTPLPYG